MEIVAAASAIDFLIFDEEDEDDDIIMLEMIQIQAVNREDRIKSLQYFEYTVPNYLPDSFKQFFKVNHETIELLCQTLGQYPALLPRAIPGGRSEIPLQKKVLMTMRYLVSQETIKELSDRFGVTEHSFIRCKRQVIETICDNLLSKFIVWPQNKDFQHISQRFDDMGTRNFPGILGAIDGSHIQIEAPSHNPKSYFNRKQFHSVVLQGVCTEDLKLIDINVGWPGRVHDAKVFRNVVVPAQNFVPGIAGLFENDAQGQLKRLNITNRM